MFCINEKMKVGTSIIRRTKLYLRLKNNNKEQFYNFSDVIRTFLKQQKGFLVKRSFLIRILKIHILKT